MYIFLIQFLRLFSRLFQFIRDQPGSMETVEPRLITIQKQKHASKIWTISPLSRVSCTGCSNDFYTVVHVWAYSSYFLLDMYTCSTMVKS